MVISSLIFLKEPKDIEIISLLDVQIQQETPIIQSAPLLDVLVSVILEWATPTPLTTPIPTPPTSSEASNITTIVPDPLPVVIQRLSDLESKFEAWTKVDHFEAIEELMQANIINKVKNQLPKDRSDDQDPNARSNQGKKKRRKGKDSYPSKDNVQTWSSKGKSSPKTSKTVKFVTIEESVDEPAHEASINSEEEVTEAMTEPTMKEYIMKTREYYGLGIPSGSDNEDANEHIEKVLKIVNLFHIPEVTQDQIMLRDFPMSLTRATSRWIRNEPSGLDVPTRQILDSKGSIPTMNVADAKKAIQYMADQHNGMSTRTRSTDTSNGLAIIQAQLNNHGKEIKKVNERVHDENSNLIKEIRAATDAAIRNQRALIKALEV
nr:hypothetical protein [Tanacetum cinerariifolium]